MDNINNLYVPIRERIFSLMKSKSISQKEFATILGVEAPTVTDWKTGRSFSFMKKLKPIADVLETTESWLINGVTEIYGMDGTLAPQESLDELFRIAPENFKRMLNRLKDEVNHDPELLAQLNSIPCAMDIFIKLYEYGKWYLEPTITLSAKSFAQKGEIPSHTVDKEEERLLILCRELNQEGREKLLGYADDLAESGKYKKAGSFRVDAKEV